MKKLSFLLLLIFSVTTSLLAQDPTAADCKQFRTGTFYLPNMPDIVITRDAEFQTETNTKTGKYIKMRITWIDDCTYQLKTLKTNDRQTRKIDKKIGVLTVVITSVDENTYHFSASSPAMAEPIKGTIIKKK
jgi:hypothetical protein